MRLLRFAPFAFAALLAPTLAARDAHAEPPPARVLDVSTLPKSPEPETVHVWYGWETMLVDAGSLAVMFASAHNENGVGTVVGLGGYAFGGPIVHLANGQPGRAGVSLALRILMPAAGAALGYAMHTKPSNPDSLDLGPGLDAAVFGFFAGLGAMVIDAAAVAHKDVPVEKHGLALAPQLGFDPKGGFHAGVGGTF